MDLHNELRSLIGLVRRRWTWLVGLRTMARASAGLAMLLVAGTIVEYVFRFQGLPLILLGAVTGILALAVAALAAWLTPRHPSDRRVARFIEERAKTLSGRELDDSLVSAIDAAERPADAGSAGFLPLMLGDAVRKLRAIQPAEILTRSELRRGALRAACGTGLLLIAIVASVPFFERAAATARLRFFPGSVRIEVLPGDVRIPAGTSLRIRASLHGSSGVLKRFTPELTVLANGERRTVTMALIGDGFELTIGSVDRTFSYAVRAGSAQSSRYTVTALTAPRVERIDLHYVYPSFAGLAPRDEQNGGDIYAPAGTRVRLRIQTDKPIARGELALGRSPAISLQAGGARTVEAELLLARDDSYRVRLADSDGLTSSGEAEYFIRLMDDRPPDVRILRPSADQQITPLEEVPIEARADDDYGIGRFDLVYSVAGGPEHIVPFERVSGTNVQKVGTRLLLAEDLGVKPGDVVTYYARARDIGRGKRSTEVTSDIFFLEVKPFNGEFVAAESQAGAGGSDPQIDSLIQAQKEIISSTWNVERRAQGGRSADDVKAIAAAQAELKGRAEQQLMSRTRRGRGRAPAPERQVPVASQPRATSGDPIATAVDAMGKALQQLATERTKEALAHEMAALNGLLQAQAEMRRRQVSQQARGAGSGGSNRAEQDLSALFDKELQRQQRTNYEARAAAETRPDRGDSQESALDRIRDLARRQEDLSRRQAELAQANLAADEMKRQLEKLTREQTALREEAEELLRRNRERTASSRDQLGQPSAGGRGAPGSQRQDALRDAADQMRSAASDLRRDDAGGAARSGQRAAEQLRRLERQVQGETAGATAAADVRLEAQQIAQEQRRIAAEADRLERNAGASAADARTRLADDKDRLAARVQDVTRSAHHASQGGKGPDATALNDAARDLQRERVADRMRETASEMRRQTAALRGTGAREQELARTLNRIADKLGTSSSAETRDLTDQLDQARAIRDRVQRAEQQLRSAEGRERDGSGRNGSPVDEGGRAQSAPGRQGEGSGDAGTGKGRQGSDVQGLRDEYQRELQRAKDALGRLSAGEPRSGLGMSTPEEQQFSRSAPGTEAFKQDRTGWESLRRNLDTALEKYEASVSDRLSRKRPDDRFSGGGSDRVPDAYRQMIAKYFESLAKQKQ